MWTAPCPEPHISYQQPLAVPEQAAAIVLLAVQEEEVVVELQACMLVGLKGQQISRVSVLQS